MRLSKATFTTHVLLPRKLSREKFMQDGVYNRDQKKVTEPGKFHIKMFKRSQIDTLNRMSRS
jgi:hypothetical protein